MKFELGVKVLILSGSKAKCDFYRFAFLKNNPPTANSVFMIQGVPYHEKVNELDSFLKENDIAWEEVAYIGDDLNDLECLKKVCWPACPNDAAPEIKDLCREMGFVSDRNGGNLAVWDFCEHLKLMMKP